MDRMTIARELDADVADTKRPRGHSFFGLAPDGARMPASA